MPYKFRNSFAEALFDAGITDNSEIAEVFYMHPLNLACYTDRMAKDYVNNRYPETMEFESSFALSYLKLFKLEAEKDPITFIQYSDDVNRAIYNLSIMIMDWTKFNEDKITELHEVLAYIIDHLYTANTEYCDKAWELYSKLNGPSNLIRLNTPKNRDPEYIPD